jgi:hypothetical protein
VASKRDIIAELLARRSRQLKRIPRLEQTERRIYDLSGAFHLLNRNRKAIPLRHRRELYRYFPIALIAITEGHFRMLYKDLIDSGEPYISRAAHFKEIKIDSEALVATASKRISVGELIAHQLPHNNLGHIESHLSILLDEDFPAEFQKYLVREDVTGGHKVFQTYLKRFVVEVFRQRHVFCHELATAVTPKRSEIDNALQIFRVFVHMVEEHVATNAKSGGLKIVDD